MSDRHITLPLPEPVLAPILRSQVSLHDRLAKKERLLSTRGKEKRNSITGVGSPPATGTFL